MSPEAERRQWWLLEFQCRGQVEVAIFIHRHHTEKLAGAGKADGGRDADARPLERQTERRGVATSVPEGICLPALSPDSLKPLYASLLRNTPLHVLSTAHFTGAIVPLVRLQQSSIRNHRDFTARRTGWEAWLPARCSATPGKPLCVGILYKTVIMSICNLIGCRED